MGAKNLWLLLNENSEVLGIWQKKPNCLDFEKYIGEMTTEERREAQRAITSVYPIFQANGIDYSIQQAVMEQELSLVEKISSFIKKSLLRLF